MPGEYVKFWRVPERSSLMRKLCLHAADISNPFKPFPICRAWAYLVLEEFFQQGDKEKAMGLTVQLLNDREKVKTAQSQIGFIEFVVCPLYYAFANIMPCVYSCAEGLIANCRQWEAEWLDTTENITEEEQAGIHGRIERLEDGFHDLMERYEQE